MGGSSADPIPARARPGTPFPRPREAPDDVLSRVVLTRTLTYEIPLVHRSVSELDRHRQRRRTVAGLLVTLAVLAVGSGVTAAWALRPGPWSPSTQVADVRPITPPGGFAVPVDRMGPVLAGLLPRASGALVTSTAYVDTVGGPELLPRAVQMGSVVYDDGSGPTLVRVELRRASSAPQQCSANEGDCRRRRLADGTIVTVSGSPAGPGSVGPPASTAVVATGPGGLEVTVLEWAGAGPSSPPSRALPPVTAEQLVLIATDPVWAESDAES